MAYSCVLYIYIYIYVLDVLYVCGVNVRFHACVAHVAMHAYADSQVSESPPRDACVRAHTYIHTYTHTHWLQALYDSQQKLMKMAGMVGTLENAKKLLEEKARVVKELKDEIAMYKQREIDTKGNESVDVRSSDAGLSSSGKRTPREERSLKEHIKRLSDVVENNQDKIKAMTAKISEMNDAQAELVQVCYVLRTCRWLEMRAIMYPSVLRL